MVGVVKELSTVLRVKEDCPKPRMIFTEVAPPVELADTMSAR